MSQISKANSIIHTTGDLLPLVAPLADFDRGSISLAGGKGANLGELIQAGFPVPEGFVITTRVYDLLFQSNELQFIVQEVLGSLKIEDPSTVAEASQLIGNTIQRLFIPPEITEAVISAYRRLGGDAATAVAVRSSATAEDLPGATFAGQQETFLNVTGE